MKRKELKNMIQDNFVQLTATYQFLKIYSANNSTTDDNSDTVLYDAMVSLNLADTRECAQELLNRIRAGMQNAEKDLSDAASQPTLENIRKSLRTVNLHENDSNLSCTGQLSEMREVLVQIINSDSYFVDSEQETANAHTFAVLTPNEQMEELSKLYQKALEKTADICLRDFDKVTDALPEKLGSQVDDSEELIYAISLAKLFETRGLLTDDLYETIGVYTHSAVYVANSKLNPEPVDSLNIENVKVVLFLLSAVLFVFLCVHVFPLGKAASFPVYFDKVYSLILLSFFPSLVVMPRVEKIREKIIEKKQHAYNQKQLDYIRNIKQNSKTDDEFVIMETDDGQAVKALS